MAPIFLKDKPPTKSVIALDKEDKENAVWVIHDFLTQKETQVLSDYMFSLPILDEAKGDGQMTEASNEGVVGVWKPEKNAPNSILKPFKALDDGPALITNYNTMLNGGDTYRFERCIRGVGFFATGSAEQCIYVKPVGAGGACVLPQQTPPFLLELLRKVSRALSTDLDGIFVNRYPTGATNLNAHSDQEGRGYDIASLSVGASRQFVVRRAPAKGEKQKLGKDTVLADVTTLPGQLIVMHGRTFQREYTHEITKQANCHQPRISLTMRRHRGESSNGATARGATVSGAAQPREHQN